MSKFIIPGELPGLNEIIEEARKNRFKSAKQKKINTEMVAWIVKGLPKMSCINIRINWFCKDKRRDKDNISGGGVKFICDGLVTAGIIKNDGWKEINDITHTFIIDKENPRVEVEMTEYLQR